jgi:hypothetical protein
MKKLILYMAALPIGWFAGCLYYNLISTGYISLFVMLGVVTVLFIIGNKLPDKE